MGHKMTYIIGCDHFSLRDQIKIIERIGCYDIVFLEALYDMVLLNEEQVEDNINNCQSIMEIGYGHVYYFKDKEVPLIGIDLCKDIKNFLHNEVDTVDNWSKSMFYREVNMLNKIKPFIGVTNNIMIVGDTHLRTIEDDLLGEKSIIWDELKDSEEVFFIRLNENCREVDNFSICHPRVLTYKDFL